MRTEATAMFTAESIKLLVKDARRRTGRTQLYSVDQDDSRDGVKVSDPTDPDDAIDPDDLNGMKPVQCALLLPPPAQSESWWTALVLGRENDAINPQDALVALAHVAYRLGYARANMATEPVMVGQLHEMVEALYGAPGWAALVSFWQEAAGIQQPRRQPKPDFTPILAAEPDAKVDTPPLPPLPPTPYEIEKGLHRALPEMPERVAAFLLHVPRDPPAWRYQESAGERAEREFLEAQGGWTG
jgi:hypothetical protein